MNCTITSARASCASATGQLKRIVPLGSAVRRRTTSCAVSASISVATACLLELLTDVGHGKAARCALNQARP